MVKALTPPSCHSYRARHPSDTSSFRDRLHSAHDSLRREGADTLQKSVEELYSRSFHHPAAAGKSSTLLSSQEEPFDPPSRTGAVQMVSGETALQCDAGSAPVAA